jgi:hypothetical protein
MEKSEPTVLAFRSTAAAFEQACTFYARRFRNAIDGEITVQAGFNTDGTSVFECGSRRSTAWSAERLCQTTPLPAARCRHAASGRADPSYRRQTRSPGRARCRPPAGHRLAGMGGCWRLWAIACEAARADQVGEPDAKWGRAGLGCLGRTTPRGPVGVVEQS